MKQRAQMKILLALLVLSMGLALWLWRSGGSEAAPAEQETVSVTNVPVSELQAAVLSNRSGVIGLMNTPEGVIVDGGEQALYSQSKLKALVYTLAHIPAQRVITAGAGDDFGLEDPQGQAVLLLPDSTLRLRLGRENPLTGEFYLQDEGSSAIYLVETAVAEQILQPVDDLRELSMFPVLDTQTMGKVSQVSISYGGAKIVLEKQAGGTVSNFFHLAAPVMAELDWEKVDTLILNPLRQLAPAHFVSDDVPLSVYGLDMPEALLELTVDGTVYRCGFSRKDENSWYCANLEGSTVSEVDDGAVSFLKTEFLDLIGNNIYSKSLADLVRIGVKYNGTQYALTVAGEGEHLTASLGDRQLDAQEALEFYRKIDTFPAASVLDGSEEIEAEPILTVAYTLRDGQEDILEFHPVSQRQCAVFVNGAADFSTYTSVITDYMAAFDALAGKV